MTRPTDLSVAEARAWLGDADAPVVLDVRTPAEFAGTHIDGALNVPVDLIERSAAEIGSQLEGEVLLVCRTDRRAHEAARLLAPTIGGRGHVLVGGMTDWNEAGLPVEQGEGGPWAMERQVRTVAGALALTGVLASTVAPKAKWLSGGIGAGLLFAGLSDTCGMSKVLEKMPWNQRDDAPTVESVTRELAQGAASH